MVVFKINEHQDPSSFAETEHLFDPFFPSFPNILIFSHLGMLLQTQSCENVSIQQVKLSLTV